MVELKKDWQVQTDSYKELGVDLPDLQVGKEYKTPKWIHFGGGNLYRGMHAEIAQDLIDARELDTGITVLETFDDETIDKGYHAFNNQILQVVMKEDGSFSKRLLNRRWKLFIAHQKIIKFGNKSMNILRILNYSLLLLRSQKKAITWSQVRGNTYRL